MGRDKLIGILRHSGVDTCLNTVVPIYLNPSVPTLLNSGVDTGINTTVPIPLMKKC